MPFFWNHGSAARPVHQLQHSPNIWSTKKTPLPASYEGAIEPLEYSPSKQGGYEQDAKDYIAGFGELETAVREDGVAGQTDPHSPELWPSRNVGVAHPLHDEWERDVDKERGGSDG